MDVLMPKNMDEGKQADSFIEVSIEQIEAREEMGCICSTDFWSTPAK
ncbi:hypothetical protein [Undibacterium sp. RuRC25W]